MATVSRRYRGCHAYTGCRRRTWGGWREIGLVVVTLGGMLHAGVLPKRTHGGISLQIAFDVFRRHA